MSALPSLSGVAPSAAPAVAPAPAPAKPRARGFLHIVRHGAGPASVYVLTYHRLESRTPRESVTLPALSVSEASLPGSAGAAKVAAPSRDVSAMNFSSGFHALPEPEARPKPILAEGAQALIDILERIGVDFSHENVRGALEDILRLGSANIPDLWLSDDEILAKGLAES
jgi:hypothetical protein